MGPSFSPSLKPSINPTTSPTRTNVGEISDDTTISPTSQLINDQNNNNKPINTGIMGGDPVLDYLVYTVVILVIIICILCCILIFSRKKHNDEKAEMQRI